MSTYYGYYCQKCKKSSEHWFNHGDHILKMILANWDCINKLREEPWLEIEILGGRGFNVFEFVEEHAGHGLLIESEYGARQNAN